MARILGDQNNWQDAWDLIPVILSADLDDPFLQLFTDFCIDGAAAGHARKLLDLVTETPAADPLEPLLIGLRVSLGEAPTVAQEILEVGTDVAERIRRRAEGGRKQ